MDWRQALCNLRTTWGLLGASFLSAVLFWLSFFPANLGALGWIALVPWLLVLAVNGQAPKAGRRRVLASAAFGGCFFILALNWMRVADIRMVATWFMLATWSSLFVLLGGWLGGRLADRFPRLGWTVALPMSAIPLEWLRSMALEGFPWYFLGHTQHDWPALIQICDVTGVYGLSLAVALVNGLLCDWVLALAPGRATGETGVSEWTWPRLRTAAVLALIGGYLVYGHQKMAPTAFVQGPQIAVLQADHPQGVRISGSASEIIADYRKLQAAATQHGNPLLLIWPETSFPGIVDLADIDPNWKPRPVRPNIPFHLLGAETELVLPDKSRKLFNSSVLVDPSGHPIIEHYDKMHRVPFGEYVPFKSALPFMNLLAPYETDYSITSGEKLTRFPLPHGPEGMTFGAAICYESGDAWLFRKLAGADGLPAVDFFVNQSNDGWFHGTEEHEQHLLLLRFRAVETRRPVIRAVNMGISGWIDAYGRVLAPKAFADSNGLAFNISAEPLPTSRWGEFKKKPFSLIGLIPAAAGSSFYVVWGDWLPALLTVLLLAALFVGKGAKKAGPAPAA